MKYFFLLTIILSCKSGPGNAIVDHNDHDTAAQMPFRPDTTSIDIHDPYKTGKDTFRLNKVMDEILKFPEVEAITKQINKMSKGTHGASIMVYDEFNGDTSYYDFMVGDNSREDRYVNIFHFLLEKKTGQIKAYDPSLDSIMSLQNWRKMRK